MDASHILVFFSLTPETLFTRGGRYVEFGYMLGCRKPILVVGPKENIFHYLGSVHHVDTWEEAKGILCSGAI